MKVTDRDPLAVRPLKLERLENHFEVGQFKGDPLTKMHLAEIRAQLHAMYRPTAGPLPPRYYHLRVDHRHAEVLAGLLSGPAGQYIATENFSGDPWVRPAWVVGDEVSVVSFREVYSAYDAGKIESVSDRQVITTTMGHRFRRVKQTDRWAEETYQGDRRPRRYLRWGPAREPDPR